MKIESANKTGTSRFYSEVSPECPPMSDLYHVLSSFTLKKYTKVINIWPASNKTSTCKYNQRISQHYDSIC